MHTISTHHRRPLLAGLAAASALTLAACGGGSYGSGSSSSGKASSGSGTSAAGASLKTSHVSLGTVVVDGRGHSVYRYDADTRGTTRSACTGSCTAEWSGVPAGASPTGTGLTGKLGTTTGPDGKPQLTLAGWPLYYYVDDTAAGDMHGQGVDGDWWALAPDGSKITAKSASSPDSDDSGDSGGGYGY